MIRPRVIIIDDVERGARLDARHLKEEYNVETITRPGDLQRRLGDPHWWQAAVVLLDMNFSRWEDDLEDGPEDGLEVLRQLSRLDVLGVSTEVIIYLQDPSFRQANVAWKLGACAYVPRCVDDYGPVKEEIQTAHRKLRLRGIFREDQSFDEKVRLAKAFPPARILLFGEAGVGKSHIAREIHKESKKKGRFVTMNLAAYGANEDLLAGDLFGTKPGAYTGAVDRPGALEQARDGTVFLDEIGDLPPRSQGLLLMALEEGVAQRLGGRKTYPVQTRFIFATNRDLKGEVEKGTFRVDLYTRLPYGWQKIRVPPLRERPAAILRLARTFLKEAEKKYGRGAPTFSPEVEHALRSHDWRGNARELQRAIDACYTLCCADQNATGVVEPRHLQLEVRLSKQDEGELDALLRLPWRQAKWNFERRYSQRLLDRIGNRSEAARVAGVARSTVMKWAKNLGSDRSVK